MAKPAYRHQSCHKSTKTPTQTELVLPAMLPSKPAHLRRISCKPQSAKGEDYSGYGWTAKLCNTSTSTETAYLAELLDKYDWPMDTLTHTVGFSSWQTSEISA